MPKREVKVTHIKGKLRKSGGPLQIERLIAGKPISHEELKKRGGYKPFGCQEGLPVGTKGCLDFAYQKEKKKIFVAGFSTNEEGGIGSKLLDRVHEIAKERGCKEIEYCLNNYNNHRARHLLKKNDYVLNPEENHRLEEMKNGKNGILVKFLKKI